MECKGTYSLVQKAWLEGFYYSITLILDTFHLQMDINHYYLLGFLQKLNKHDTRESTRHWVVAEYLVLLALTSCENFGSFNGSLNSPRKGPWKATEKHYTRLLPCLGQCQ